MVRRVLFRLAAVLLALAGTLFVLEVVLQMASVALDQADRSKGRVPVEGEIRISCVGESTTFGKWPGQLKRLQNLRPETMQRFRYSEMIGIQRELLTADPGTPVYHLALLKELALHHDRPQRIDEFFANEVGVEPSMLNDEERQREIPVVAMQYPLLPVESLRKLLDYREDLSFLENRTNFETALLDSKYRELFEDNFAGSFGHLSPRGNQLVAENVADALAELMPELGLAETDLPKR